MKRLASYKSNRAKFILTEKFASGANISGKSKPVQVCNKIDLDSRHRGQGTSNNNSLFRTS